MKSIVLKHVVKAYGQTPVVRNLNMEIKEGERLILLGPSGCGKSTTLRMVAGLEEITDGKLFMGGKVVNDVPCGKRNVAMVFQNYALFPHMTVEQNITYGLRAHKMEKAEIKRRFGEVVKMLELSGLEQRKPKDLSGGQRQRVALARAVVKRADYFLLDEPLSNLDAQLRFHARKELVRIHETYRPTMMYVTHDQMEAMTVGQRIALMNDGVLQMLDTPSNVYHCPANVFTAKFIGSPSMNIVEAVYEAGSLVIGGQKLPLPDMWCRQIQNSGKKEFYFGIRPEHIRIERYGRGEIRGTVNYVEDHGNQRCIFLSLGGKELAAIRENDIPFSGGQVSLVFPYEKIHLFDRKTEKSIGYPDQIKKEEIQIYENIS